MRFGAGLRGVDVTDGETGAVFPMLVFYPAHAPERAERLGRYTLDVARDAPAATGWRKRVLISHGDGGTPLVYRTLARELARRGFIVGVPEHPFNNLINNSASGTADNLRARPRQLRAAVDALLQHRDLAPDRRPEAGLGAPRVAVIGHSLGGYAALALAGGVAATLPGESPGDATERIALPRPDRRVDALVLLAPATMWFRLPGALDAVTARVLMLGGEHDRITGPPHERIVTGGLPAARVAYRVIENAGHFSFLSPFPPELARPEFAPSQDPPGFDRARFGDELAASIDAFLSATTVAVPPDVRAIGPDEWVVWRGIRHSALAEAPYAFGTKLAEWQGAGDTEARWRARLSTVPFNVAAFVDGEPAGIVSATAPDQSGTVELISMWVAPFARGRGTGDALVAAVIAWARSRDADRVTADVVAGNAHAHALYARHGFVDAGPVSDGDGDAGEAPERRMVLTLAG